MREKLRIVRRVGWRKVVQEHEAAWSERWHSSDFEIAGDPAAEKALRFAAYHLNSAANPADAHVSIGARGLTGDDYHGHVFWDTEIYLLPFYTFTWPKAARALLMYRHRTIEGARAKAAKMGWRGAMYAWESADTGAETTPEQVARPDGQIVDILCGKQEQHITADIAYAVWQYWQATGDVGFLLEGGAEILLETGRFWSSRAQLEFDGYCHIRGIIGPDEYHEQIDDNAYTNVMARWNIRRALEIVALLRERWPDDWARLSSSIGLSDAEIVRWRTVAETMATGWDPQTGLFEEFHGFFDLEEIDLAIVHGPLCADGRGAWAGANAALEGGQAGGCRCTSRAVAGGISRRQRASELPILRAALRPRQFSQRHHAWARGCPPGRDRSRIAVLPRYGGD